MAWPARRGGRASRRPCPGTGQGTRNRFVVAVQGTMANPGDTTMRFALAIALSAALIQPHARAAVSPEEAQQLKSNLTPMGAERAGNKDGTIPAWTGGMTAPAADYKPGGVRP